MGFQLSDVVPWGRSFDEYRAMFGLTSGDLQCRILGCGDGPAGFNAIATERGCRVLSVDPLYRFSAEQIRMRIDVAAVEIAEQTRRNAHEFVWQQFASVEELIAARLLAMEVFLKDYPAGREAGRYLEAGLPSLPLPGHAFDLALCANFLFLYSSQHDLNFHIQSLLELARVAKEVRVFPLMELGSILSRHLESARDALRGHGLVVDTVQVPYELQRGGNRMIRITQMA